MEDNKKQLEVYDREPATIGDVNKAATNVYKILLGMVKVMNDTQQLLIEATNETRKLVGLEPLPMGQQDTGADTGKDTNEPTS